jgi:hypothetical protein
MEVALPPGPELDGQAGQEKDGQGYRRPEAGPEEKETPDGQAKEEQA